MGFIPKVEMVTTPWTRHFKDVRFLFICFLFVISDAAVLLDFPGPYTCLDDGIQVTKPVSMSLNSWKSLHIVDPNGGKVEACDLHPNESNVTIPWTCINYEAGRKNTYVSFIKWSITNLVYKITCRDYQADSDYQAYSGPVTECGTDSMMVKISRTLSGFSDESVVGPPVSTWMVVIYNGTQKTKVNVTTAKIYGYVISSDNDHFMIQIDYDALGIQMLPADGTRFYHGNIDLILEKLSPKITIEVKIICARGTMDKCNIRVILDIAVGKVAVEQQLSSSVSLKLSILMTDAVDPDPQGERKDHVNWNRLLESLKVVTLLLGMPVGYTNYCCCKCERENIVRKSNLIKKK
ncbi:zona pellucida sperm-binding protein 2-like [Mantella aurantiaca]